MQPKQFVRGFSVQGIRIECNESAQHSARLSTSFFFSSRRRHTISLCDWSSDVCSSDLFFFKVGALTFGGGLTMLVFVQDQVVNQLHWLTPQEFLDGLALGQLTPGPILMLAAYVGYKVAGFGGATVGGIAIFLPSFILMLSVMPVLARLRHLLWIKAAMRGISAASIGAIGVSLLQMAPHAAPDAFALFLLALTVVAILAWRAGPLPLMLGGA